MTDDLVMFSMLIVSDVAAERDLLRRAALNASFHVDVSEIEKCVDAKPIRAHFLRESVDFIFVDSRMPKAGRQAVGRRKVLATLLPRVGDGKGLGTERQVVGLRVPEHIDDMPGDLVQVGLDFR